MRTKSIPAPATSIGAFFDIFIILLRLIASLLNFLPSADSAIP